MNKSYKLMPLIYIASKDDLKVIKTIDSDLSDVKYSAVKGKYFAENKEGDFVFLTKKEFAKQFEIRHTFGMIIASHK